MRASRCVWVVSGLAALVVAGSSTAAGTQTGTYWSTPRVLVPLSRNANSPELAVGGDGVMAAGWLAGTPPVVTSGGTGTTGTQPSTPRPLPPWYGHKVTIDRGRTTRGFGRPVVLSRRAQGSLHVAISGSGTTYVAWSPFPRGGPVIAYASQGGSFSRARRFLPAGAQLIAFASGPDGPVLAVWDEFPPLRLHEHASIDYAPLEPDGRLGHAVVVSNLQGDDSAQIAVSVNDGGGLAAAWVRGVGSPASVVRAVVCSAAGSCTLTPAVERYTAPFDVGVALSDDGTVSVVSDVGTDGGVLAAVSHNGGPFSRGQRLASAGDAPVAAADATGGALTVFNDGDGAPARDLKWALLPTNGENFTRAITIPDPNEIYTPALAANLAGDFVIAWSDQTDTSNSSLAAAVGAGGRPGQAAAHRRK